jgi:Mrp family chromosome partitioning ATPase
VTESQVLASCLHSRDAFNRINRFLVPTDFSTYGEVILAEVARFYEVDKTAKQAAPAVIAQRLRQRLSPKQADLAVEALQGLKPELSSENVALAYLEQRRQVAGERLAEAIAARRPQKEIEPLRQTYTDLCQATDLDTAPAEEVAKDWADVFESELNNEKRIPLAPSALNAVCGGGVLRGDCVVLFGRPNAGKSLFAINLAAVLLKRGLRVLWIENEDRGNRTKFRLATRISGRSAEQIAQDRDGSRELVQAACGDRFIYVSATPGTVGEIEQAISEHKPDCVIVNQIRNVIVPKAESFTRSLDVVCQRVRALGKKYGCVTVLITQAGAPMRGTNGEAKERAVLYKDDVDSSRTGVAAAADVMIGYGVTAELREQKIACLSVCKNKNGPETHFYVHVNPSIDKLFSKANL